MASESRNLAQQRREKDGIVYFERGILTGRDGRRYQRYAIQTHFVEVGESAAELVKKYVLPLAQPGDVLSITAKVMAMCTGNVRRMEDMKLGFFAKHMAKFAGINSTGVGMHEPYKLQLVIDMVGLPRVLLAGFVSAVTPRPRRKRHPRRIAVFWLSEFVPFTQKLVGQAAISKKVFILLQKNSIITP